MVVAFSRPPTPSRQSPARRQQLEQNAHPETPNESTARLPLKDNGVVSKKPRGKQVSSRYLSPSPSSSSSSSTPAQPKTTRFPSPLICRSTNSTSNPTLKPAVLPLNPKRSQSADRRRSSGTPVPQGNGNGAELSAATKMLITSARSFSVSFQGEAFSLPISKTKAQVTPTLSRRPTPERRRATPVRDHGENSKPMDKQLWPARQGNLSSNPLSRSLSYSSEKKVVEFGSGLIGVKSLPQPMMLDDDSVGRISFDGSSRLNLDLGSAELLKESRQNLDANSVNEVFSVSCDFTASDTDSMSSGSTNSGAQEYGGGDLRGKSVPRGIGMSARFWQETNSRLKRLQDPGSPLSPSPGTRNGSASKLSQSKRFSSDGVVSSPRTMASPTRGATRPASPSKLWASVSLPFRGLSPGRLRNALGGGQMSSNSIDSPSILSFSVDIRRGKMGEDRMVDAHMVRLLYNRYMQWRLANARVDATLTIQKLNSEKNLWNAWLTISELRHSVTLKRIRLLLLRQKLKLTSILKGQISCLEEWALLDRDHSSSLLGVIGALKASTLRLPIVGKATVDMQNLKDAICSAGDVMQAMMFSMGLLSSKVEEMNSLVAELVNLTAKEKVTLERCKDFLSVIAAIKVKDCSLRTHIIQLNRPAA